MGRETSGRDQLCHQLVMLYKAFLAVDFIRVHCDGCEQIKPMMSRAVPVAALCLEQCSWATEAACQSSALTGA